MIAPTAFSRSILKPAFLLRSNTSSVRGASSSKNSTSRDTLAGRLRFYKQVGVTAVSPPWEKGHLPSSAFVACPISAGVDGSQSASGVDHLLQGESDTNNLRTILSPRSPGENETTCVEDWFGVTLDGKTIRSPMGQILAVPSESLAFAIAAEWDAQRKYLQPSQMPLMTFVCTALDQAAMRPHVYREQCLAYLLTDTVCQYSKICELISFTSHFPDGLP